MKALVLGSIAACLLCAGAAQACNPALAALLGTQPTCSSSASLRSFAATGSGYAAGTGFVDPFASATGFDALAALADGGLTAAGPSYLDGATLAQQSGYMSRRFGAVRGAGLLGAYGLGRGVFGRGLGSIAGGLGGIGRLAGLGGRGIAGLARGLGGRGSA